MKRIFTAIILAIVAPVTIAADLGDKQNLRANFRHQIGVGFGAGFLTGHSSSDLSRYSFPCKNTPVGFTPSIEYRFMVDDRWGIGADFSGTFIYGDSEYPENDRNQYEYFSYDDSGSWILSGFSISPIYRVLRGKWALIFQLGVGASFYNPRYMSKDYVRQNIETDKLQGITVNWSKSTCFAITPKVSVMRQLSHIFGLTASIGYRQSFGDIEGQYKSVNTRGETLQSFRRKNFGGNSLIVQVGVCLTLGQTVPGQ